MNKNKKAFTLIELLVVVLIIGILAAIAVPQYQKATAKAELYQLVSIIKSVKLAQERYYLANNKYATDMKYLDLTVKDSNTSCYTNGTWVECWNRNFDLLSYLEASSTAWKECSTRSLDLNSVLTKTCQDFMGITPTIKNCAGCQRFFGKPCVVASDHISHPIL